MPIEMDSPSRRNFLAAFGAAMFTTPGLFADQLARTPQQTEGRSTRPGSRSTRTTTSSSSATA